jgi:hypothetical protein
VRIPQRKNLATAQTAEGIDINCGVPNLGAFTSRGQRLRGIDQFPHCSGVGGCTFRWTMGGSSNALCGIMTNVAAFDRTPALLANQHPTQQSNGVANGFARIAFGQLPDERLYPIEPDLVDL